MDGVVEQFAVFAFVESGVHEARSFKRMGSGRFPVWLHVNPLGNLGEIVGYLHARPGVGRAAERSDQPDRHFGGDPRLFADQVVKGLPADFQDARGSVTLRPSGSRHSSRTIRPGWGGFFMGYAASWISTDKHLPSTRNAASSWSRRDACRKSSRRSTWGRWQFSRRANSAFPTRAARID